MHNFKMIVAYDGTNYMGWQKTFTGPSIESTLQQTLEQILQQSIILQAASRTDRGVHAIGQVVNFLALHSPVDLHRFKISLNCLLPKDITVISIEEAPVHFHPTIDCTGKEYRYFICFDTHQLPFHRLYSWHIHEPNLNIDLMKKAIPYLIGTHDFSSFCNTKKQAAYQNKERNVDSIEMIELENNRLCISIKGNNFLYKMVRTIVGTMIDIGKGKIQIEHLSEIMKALDRTKTGVTAPAHGLFLQEVFYPSPSSQ